MWRCQGRPLQPCNIKLSHMHHKRMIITLSGFACHSRHCLSKKYRRPNTFPHCTHINYSLLFQKKLILLRKTPYYWLTFIRTTLPISYGQLPAATSLTCSFFKAACACYSLLSLLSAPIFSSFFHGSFIRNQTWCFSSKKLQFYPWPSQRWWSYWVQSFTRWELVGDNRKNRLTVLLKVL